MSDDVPSDGPDSRRALLAVVAVLGLVAASTAAPVLANQTPLGGLDSPQAPSDAPSFLQEFDELRHLLGGSQPDVPVEGSSGAFGALSLGESTDVGGPISEQQRTDAATPHFVAETQEPTYWRTGAYVEYTGSGWERDSVNQINPSRQADQRERNWYAVTLRQPATALPSPWRPVDIRHACTDAETCGQTFSQTDTGGVRARPGLGAGAQYSVEAVEPVSDPDRLRDVRVRGSIASTKYTSVETTDRVEQLADRVVGDADNRYDAARAVETYLESEKEYSLSDVPEPGDQITDQFLFEQDKGYCEYYATSMVVMLRSQDIPARYVAGYAPGERVGNDRYLVRGADAHAWVEVYFEGLGWVRFDPTPSAPRQAADDSLGDGSPSYRIQLNQSAVPGEQVTASVTTAGVPASTAAVYVNGERVGTTNVDGEVVFTVPYAETLDVTVQPEEERSSGGVEPVGHSDNASGFGVASFAQPDDEDDGADGTTQEFDVNTNVRFQFDGEVEPGAELPVRVTVAGKSFENAAVSVAGVQQGRTDSDGRTTVEIPDDASGVVRLTASRDDLSKTTTYPVDDLSVAVSPSLVAPFPTTDATARVTAGGEAVEGAVVHLDGERVGTTDADGRLQFEIPFSQTPEVTATGGGERAVTYVDGVLPVLGVTVLLALIALGAAVLTARHRGVTVDSVVTALVHVVSEAVSTMIEALVGVVDALDELTAEFREAAEDGWRGVLAWLASLPGRVSAPDAGAWFAGVVAAIRAGVDDDRAAKTTASGDAEQAAGHLQSVWRRFVALVGVERWETKTPGEVARRAVRAGFPREPVYALTNAFRDAAYGGRPADSRLDRARDALSSLRDDEEEGEQ